jgi:WS/DGAT/MGAT family acyltransferase
MVVMPAPQRLSALEATFLALSTPEVPFVPGCVLELDRPLALEPLQGRIAALLAEIPRYRQRIARAPVVGSLAWVDDEAFAINRHVRTLRVPEPGGEPQLEAVVAQLLTAGVPVDHPPWQVWTVEGLADGRGALIALVHHALVDGVAGIALLERLLRLSRELPDRNIRIAVADRARPRARPLLERFIERAAADLRGRAAAWRQITTQLEARRHAPALVELLGQALHPSSDLGLGVRRISRDRSFSTFTVGLDTTKSIKRAFGVTVNDVLLACISGALRRYLARRGVDPSRLTDIRAMVPVSRRARDEHATSGNRVTLLLVGLAIDEPDAVTRLRRISERTRELKRHDIAGAGDVLVALSDLTWSGVLANVFRLALARRAFNIGVTNVPGPPIPLYLLDARVTRIAPIMNLWPGIPIAIAIASYAGAVTISIDADRAAITDLAPFVADLDRAFEELRAAATPASVEAPSPN